MKIEVVKVRRRKSRQVCFINKEDFRDAEHELYSGPEVQEAPAEPKTVEPKTDPVPEIPKAAAPKVEPKKAAAKGKK